MTTKSRAAVTLGKMRAANLTTADRSANARAGWRRLTGPEHITADQRRVLHHLRGQLEASAVVGPGIAGTRFEAAAHELHDRQIIVTTAFPPGGIVYQRGPKWDAELHVRDASKNRT